jgi:hypothetical protein
MLEAARDLSFAHEAGVDARVHRLGVRVHLLDSDLAADAFVEAEEHAPDAPGPDLAAQRIVLGEADRGRGHLAAAIQTAVEDGAIDDRGELGGVAVHDGSFRMGYGSSRTARLRLRRRKSRFLNYVPDH